MSGVVGRTGWLGATAALAAAIGSGGSMLGSMPNVTPSVSAIWAPRYGRMRSRTPGRHGYSGSKLWRKASEGKLGLRW